MQNPEDYLHKKVKLYIEQEDDPRIGTILFAVPYSDLYFIRFKEEEDGDPLKLITLKRDEFNIEELIESD